MDGKNGLIVRPRCTSKEFERLILFLIVDRLGVDVARSDNHLWNLVVDALQPAFQSR